MVRRLFGCFGFWVLAVGLCLAAFVERPTLADEIDANCPLNTAQLDGANGNSSGQPLSELPVFDAGDTLPLLAAIQQHATSVPAIDFSRPQAGAAAPDLHVACRKDQADRSDQMCRVVLKNHGRSFCIRFCCWVA